jgi:hypothetical protein
MLVKCKLRDFMEFWLQKSIWMHSRLVERFLLDTKPFDLYIYIYIYIYIVHTLKCSLRNNLPFLKRNLFRSTGQEHAPYPKCCPGEQSHLIASILGWYVPIPGQ